MTSPIFKFVLSVTIAKASGLFKLRTSSTACWFLSVITNTSEAPAPLPKFLSNACCCLSLVLVACISNIHPSNASSSSMIWSLGASGCSYIWSYILLILNKAFCSSVYSAQGPAKTFSLLIEYIFFQKLLRAIFLYVGILIILLVILFVTWLKKSKSILVS